MKRIYFYALAILASFSIASCDLRKDNEFEEAVDTSGQWNKSIKFELNTVSGGLAVAKDMKSGDVTVPSDNGVYELTVNTEDLTKIKTIDVYVLMIEEGGMNSAVPLTELFKYKTIAATDLDADGKIQLTVSMDDFNTHFASELTNDRSSQKIYIGDKLEVFYVVTGTDGAVYDSRLDFTAYEFPINEEKSLSPFAGTFNYEWVFVTSEGVNWGKVNVGDSGSVTFAPDSYDATSNSGVFSSTNKFSFDYYYGYNAGSFTYDYANDQVLNTTGCYWHIKRLDDQNIYITWMYSFTKWDEFGVVKLTRTDGAAWPANINGDSRIPSDLGASTPLPVEYQ